MKSHPIQDLLSFRLGGEELGSLDVAAEDRIRERRRGLLRPVDDDFDFPGPDLLRNVSDAVEIGVEQERLANRLVVDRRICEADFEGSQISLADRETTANCPKALCDPFHVVAERQMVFEQRLQPALEGLVVDSKKIDDETLEGGLKALLENHLPLGYYMKGIAERFGAIRRGLTVGEGDLRSLEIRFANTPIYDEAVREALLLHADFDRVREIVHKIRAGDIEVVIHWSEETPTPLAYPILRRYVEAPELFSPEAEREEVLDRMRLHLSSEPVHLLCFECGHFHEEVRIGQMPDHPECKNCKSRLLTVLGWAAWTVRDAYAKRVRKLDLTDEEKKLLTRSKQVADLVAVYGKRAVYANSVYGVGPTTASKILAKMQDTEKEFLNDLFEAKLKYVTTRPYWNEPQAKPKLY